MQSIQSMQSITTPFVAAILATAALGRADPAPAPPPSVVTNTGLAADLSLGFYFPVRAQLSGPFAAFWADEAEQGQDLDGDGTLLGKIVHVFDGTTQSAINVGVATNVCLLEGSRFLVGLREATFAKDYNGDGDTLDQVLFLHDFATGVTVNLGRAAHSAIFDGSLIFMLVSELAQGNQDLNGDGDTMDDVIHVYDVTAGTFSNLGLLTWVFLGDPLARIEGDLVAFRADEMQMGVDLNGDGDTNDGVPHVYDRTTGVATSLGHAGCCTDLPILGGRYVAFLAAEAGDGGTDWNGDGDALDEVLHVYDSVTGLISNLGLPLYALNDHDAGRLAFSVDESTHGGVDLNGDGDGVDSVLHVWDAASATVTNLGVATAGWLRIRGDRIAYAVDEQAADLNGDGDQGDDVVQVLDLVQGTTWNVGLAGVVEALSGPKVVVSVTESGQGNADLDGDGQVWASIMHVHDTSTGETRNLGLRSVASIDLADDLLTFVAAEGVVDQNGDGDTGDEVLQAVDLAGGAAVSVPLAIDAYPYVRDGARVLTVVREAAQGGTDSNGDGDALDQVAHLLDLAPASCGAIRSYGAGCTAGGGTAPQLSLYGCPRPGDRLTLRIVTAAPHANAFLFFGAQPAALPMTPGCTLNVTPLLPSALGPLPTSATGAFVLPATLPATTLSGTVTMQAFVDFGGGAFANSQGIEVTVPP